MAKGKSGLTAPTVPTPAAPPQPTPGPQLTPGFEFLGPQGPPIDMNGSMVGANPNFDSQHFDPKYWRNCQRCVWAYEMRRRGYDVEARERILDGSDTLPYMGHKQGWANVAQNGVNELVSLSSYGTIKQILTQMSDWGDGARAIVRIRYKKGGGHVFIAEQVNGGTIFVEPQAGTYKDIHATMDKVIKKETKLLRIDNKQLDPKLLERAVKITGS